ncbi:MAG: D-alanyl-D-alanine carboxypeptidase [Ruminococcus flavefaciens]|nr:D-alanyl-D-alanine carboxypeptidase [Ruminococcus flavefaciens]MCM1229101.1 D-alanyl-D-alanine carboxypeptidase [Ruminococcus flavefaciens]
MKKFAVILSSALLLCGMRISDVYAEEIEISAKAAVVISADTGEILFEKNSSEKLPMASTTKIMTTLICLESGNLDEPFVVDSDAIHVEGSSMGLQEGDTVTKYALCCGMLLPSGNDAANATAVKIAGSIEAFADIMNDKAKELGLTKTYFVTPSGLEGEGHGSSAYDMAVLASTALRNDIFREICSSETIKLEYGNPPYTRWLKNTNKLLSLYSGTYGVKTGFTDEAGRCLVSACERDGKNLVCVTLNDRNDWNDHIAMYDECFKLAKTVSPDIPENIQLDIAGSDRDKISVRAESVDFTSLSADSGDFECVVNAPPFIYAPVSEGEELATMSIYYKNREIKQIPLYSAENAEYKLPEPEKEKNFITKIKEFFS